MIFQCFQKYRYLTSTFKRSGIYKVLELARSGRAICIIVKDLSRFGREYIEAGHYSEYIFSALGVRFIIINDRFGPDDFRDEVPGIEITVRNIMNSYISQEQPYKIKKSICQQRKMGGHVGANTPYGYRKTRGYGNQLLVDHEAMFIIQRIFHVALEGYGRSEIARTLNTEGTPTPGDYKQCKRYHRDPLVEKRGWGDAAVSHILKDEAYIETTVSGQYHKPEMGKRYVKVALRQQWGIIENAYPAIIDRGDFQRVQGGFKKTDHI